MKKRLLTLLLAGALLTAAVPAALAAPIPSQEQAATALAALDIMTGCDDGQLHLERRITKAEFTKMCVAASPMKDSVGTETATAPYPDVPRAHWAAGYIRAAVDAGLARGNLAGYFEPDRDITLAEGVTMVLRLMGYADAEFSGAWPAGQMAKYRALDMDRGVLTTDPNQPLTRYDALYLFYNLGLTKTKDNTTYYVNLLKPGHQLVNANGELNLVALINAAMEGPVVADGSWQLRVPFDVTAAAVTRNGKPSTLAAINPNDVIYYSKPMKSLWVYTNKATGAIQAVSPSTSSPGAVTVAGKTYTLSTPSAVYALSDLGPYRVGDNVTLLLGRDNTAVAVADPEQVETTLYGLVTAVRPAGYIDADGNTYTDSTATLVATDGSSYSFRCDPDKVKVGQLAEVTTGKDGASFRTLSATALSGKVNAAGTKLGNYTFAADAEILDTYGKTEALRVYPARLAGMEIADSMTAWYRLNSAGEIDRLILKEATGDMHTYGVVISSTEVSTSYPYLQTQGVYVYDAGGQVGQLAGGTVYNVDKGPFVMKWSEGEVDRFQNLSSVRLTQITGQTAAGGDNRRYALADQVLVYQLRDGDYYLSALDLVKEGFSLTGYYDKAEAAGGRIRVIVAREQ